MPWVEKNRQKNSRCRHQQCKDLDMQWGGCSPPRGGLVPAGNCGSPPSRKCTKGSRKGKKISKTVVKNTIATRTKRRSRPGEDAARVCAKKKLPRKTRGFGTPGGTGNTRRQKKKKSRRKGRSNPGPGTTREWEGLSEANGESSLSTKIKG